MPRLTLNLGLRWDAFNGRVPAQRFRATPFIPARETSRRSPTPSGSRTSTRVMGARVRSCSAPAGPRSSSPSGATSRRALSGLVTNINPLIDLGELRPDRTWNDDNVNFVPDCDLANFGQNGECGPISDLNFGQNRPGATIYDDSITQGFGNRNYTWDMSAEVVHELAPASR